MLCSIKFSGWALTIHKTNSNTFIALVPKLGKWLSLSRLKVKQWHEGAYFPYSNDLFYWTISDLIHRSRAVYVTEAGNVQAVCRPVSTVPDHVLNVAGQQHLFNCKAGRTRQYWLWFAVDIVQLVVLTIHSLHDYKSQIWFGHAVLNGQDYWWDYGVLHQKLGSLSRGLLKHADLLLIHQERHWFLGNVKTGVTQTL